MSALLAQQTNKNNNTDDLVAALNRVREQTPGGGNNNDKPKVKSPEVFNGDRTKLSNFLMQVNLVFKQLPGSYSSDTSKIYYTIGFLRGAPETSIRSYINLADDKAPDYLKDLGKFQAYLKEKLGDADDRWTAAREIKKVRQRSSAALYLGCSALSTIEHGAGDPPQLSR